MTVDLVKRREDAEDMKGDLHMVLVHAQEQLQSHPAMARAKAALDVWDIKAAESQTKILSSCPEAQLVKLLETAIEHQDRVLAAIDKALGVAKASLTPVGNDQEVALK